VEAGEAEEWTRVEADLMLQFITALFFFTLIIVFILFYLSLLGVLRGWCKKVWSWWSEGWCVDGRGWMALLFL
jgi:hypothetical protein